MLTYRMLQLDNKMIGEMRTPKVLLKRTEKYDMMNVLSTSRRPSSEKVFLYFVLALQILFVLPLPALALYFVPKPKYIVPMFVVAAVFQVFPAALMPKNRPLIFFCLCGALLMLFEAFIYMMVTTA